jgi:hypothetical protein
VERELTIQLPTAEAQEIDYERAATCIRPLPGRFYAIEHGRTEKIGNIYLSERAGVSLQSDALTVIAAGEGVSLSPGESILVRPTHGDWIEGFEVPGWRAPLDAGGKPSKGSGLRHSLRSVPGANRSGSSCVGRMLRRAKFIPTSFMAGLMALLTYPINSAILT